MLNTLYTFKAQFPHQYIFYILHFCEMLWNIIFY